MHFKLLALKLNHLDLRNFDQQNLQIFDRKILITILKND